jgi:DNA-binding beta-propeller fold protein YncE
MSHSKHLRPVAVGLTLACLAGTAPAQSVLQTLTTGGVDDAEITPDGRLAVLREHSVGLDTVVHILDMETGAELAAVPCATMWTGVCQDAVAVTNERAIVLGSCVSVIDLTQPTFPVLGNHEAGTYPRDVALTPDGSLAAVRGGSSNFGPQGGLFLYELDTGSQLARFDGEPTPGFGQRGVEFDVDSVVATDEHAVFVSEPVGPEARTRVTVVALRPDGGTPAIVYETSGADDQRGVAHDITLTPGGRFAAVRSDESIALYRLNGARSKQVWHRRLFGSPGGFGGSAMDSVVATAGRIATISRVSNGAVGAQLDVFDLHGQQAYDRFAGDPHDLELTPDGSRLVVRTSAAVLLYELGPVAFGGRISPLDEVAVGTSHTSFGAGLDSVALSDQHAVTLHRTGTTTEVRLWSLAGGALTETGNFALPNKPCDVALSPDGSTAVVTGTDHVQVIEVATGALTLDFDPVVGKGFYPWCDGVVMTDTHALAFGYTDIGALTSTGWAATIDLLAP